MSVGSHFRSYFRFMMSALLLAVTLIAPKSVFAAFDTQVAYTISWFYAAAFDRTPIPNSTLPNYGDLNGLAFWTNAFLAGDGRFQGNMRAIADSFVASPEFQAKYPASLTDVQFVNLLYNNILGREPDALGFAYWIGRLNAGDSRGTVLADFANSVENENRNPARKAALQVFIVFIAADADGTITPTEAATWLAANPDLDGAVVDDESSGQAEIRAVQLDGAEEGNRYDLFVGQALATGPALVEFSEGQQSTLEFTLRSGPTGLTVDAHTGALNYQSPEGMLAGSKPFQMRVTSGTATFDVAGSLELVVAQQVETAFSGDRRGCAAGGGGCGFEYRHDSGRRSDDHADAVCAAGGRERVAPEHQRVDRTIDGVIGRQSGTLCDVG